jgi:DNA repair exonuclease SbcCD ATPase subunit
MVENHKLKNMEEYCKKLEEQMQNLQQESLVDQQNKRQEQFGEQNERANHISLQIETLSNQFHTFLAHQMAGKDLGSNSMGILNTPTMNN